MDKHIITETINGVTNYISLNNEGQLVKVQKNPMTLPAFMTKEQAFEVIKGLRLAAQGTENKYRVKAVSQALRDMITDIIYNELPESQMVTEEFVKAFAESMKPKEVVKSEAEPEAEAPAEEEPKAKKAAKKK